jgi:DNA-binding response OmpR family regulator
MDRNARRVLVIEDDPDTAQQLVDCLRTSGYTVDLARDGDQGLALGRGTDYVVMTVDRMLPHLDGIEVIRRFRDDGIVTPTLIISALGEVDDRVRGLRAGDQNARHAFTVTEWVILAARWFKFVRCGILTKARGRRVFR